MGIKRTLLILFCVTSQSFAAFSYYSPVTVDHTKVPSTQTDFPVPVSVTDARFATVANGGHVQSSSGFDIRPYSDSGLSSALTYELESYNATTGAVTLWVKIASLSSSSDTVIYLGYCDAALTTDGSNGPSTFSNNFYRVYHAGDGATLNRIDSVIGGLHYNLIGTPTATTGQIDGGAGLLSASSQYVNNGSANNPSSAAITMSARVNATSFPNTFNGVIQLGINLGVTHKVEVKSNGKIKATVTASSVITYDGTGAITLSTGTWYYIAMTYDSTNGMNVYVNNALDKNVAANGNHDGSLCCDIQFGHDRDETNAYWNGTIDEARVSTVARSADWMTTDYNSGFASFESLGSETPTGVPCPGVVSVANPLWFFFFPN